MSLRRLVASDLPSSRLFGQMCADSSAEVLFGAFSNALAILHFLAWLNAQPETGWRLKQQNDGGAKTEVTKCIAFLHHHSTCSAAAAAVTGEALVIVTSSSPRSLNVC